MSRQRKQPIGVLILSLVVAMSRGAIAAPGEPKLVLQAASNLTAQTDPVIEAQVKEIASNLRCPTCRALSVFDSPSEMAGEMRGLIREQLTAGMTADEVYAYFVERYGEWILLKPTASGFNWTVWLLPLLLLAVGLVVVLSTASRWVKRGREREATLTETDS